MKQLFSFAITIILFTSCEGQQSKAMKDQQQAFKALDKVSPGQIPTTDAGWMMKATVNGKPWIATSMFPPKASGRIIGYLGKESISLPYWENGMEAGKTKKFSDHNAVDIFREDDVQLWGGREGEMTITKVGGGWAEGTFNVTAHNDGKTLTITNGSFRIKL